MSRTAKSLLWLEGRESRHFGWDDSYGSGRNASGVRVDSSTALQSTVILACARVLAESVAALPLHLYKRTNNGGKECAREHPLYSILHLAPNDWQTSFEFREQAMLHLCLHGNFYCEIKSGSVGAVSSLVPLHPSRMKVERIENGRLRYKYREQTGSETVYTQDEIMHIRWMSDDGVNGMVPIELAKDAIGLARACELHGASFFGNGARPGVILRTDQDLPVEAAERLRDNWERMHRGVNRSNRTAVLSGGLTPVELGGNNQESQFLESRRFQVEECCRLFKVPPHMIGDLSRSSFSNIEQQSIDFVQHTLLPWLRRFESAYTRDLIVDDAIYFAEFDTRGLLRGDAAARSSYYNTLWNLGVASINEIRSWENLNPIEGGDARFVQLNMQTLPGSEPEQDEPLLLEGSPIDSSPEVTPPDEPQLSDTSLNGAQITGLLEILTQLNSGIITKAAAEAIIVAAFPTISPDAVKQMIGQGAGELPEPTIKELQRKARRHNRRMKEAAAAEWTRVRVPTLKEIYKRAAGAFNDADGGVLDELAQARVDAFLLLSSGDGDADSKLLVDNDLLHRSHPDRNKSGRDGEV